MNAVLLVAASMLALAASPAAAQSMSMPMPGMPDHAHHPKPAKQKPRPVTAKPHAAPAGSPAAMPQMSMPAPAGQSSMPATAHPTMPATPGMAGMEGMTTMTGMAAALGPYPMSREASGTSWQPDTSRHQGVMTTAGGWHLMGMGVLNLVADTQGSRRGADKLFASGMLMGMAQRPLGDGTLQFKAMLSPDPLMGKRGYPLLLASGETADGVTRLTDRQHPHDLFMELSASVAQNLGSRGSAFLYAGLPGEPAFGPPAFMHRESIMDSPEAPISHHWLDSTHISFGVLTAGLVLGQAKLEVSRFNGREPDQHRFDLETGPLDSTAIRVSWNPRPQLALQASWGHFTDPEQLEPGVDQKRLSASALYTVDLAGWHWASTLAWGRKSAHGHGDDAWVLESALRRNRLTLFGRAELTENRELLGGTADDRAFRVGKLSLGLVRDLPVGPHLALGLGALGSLNVIPAALAESYGARRPLGAMAFVRFKLE